MQTLLVFFCADFGFIFYLDCVKSLFEMSPRKSTKRSQTPAQARAIFYDLKLGQAGLLLYRDIPFATKISFVWDVAM